MEMLSESGLATTSAAPFGVTAIDELRSRSMNVAGALARIAKTAQQTARKSIRRDMIGTPYGN
jgi:hypothetical protein